MRTILAIGLLLLCFSVAEAQHPFNGRSLSRYTPYYGVPQWYVNSLPYPGLYRPGYPYPYQVSGPIIFYRRPVFNRVPVYGRTNVRTGVIYNRNPPNYHNWKPNVRP